MPITLKHLRAACAGPALLTGAVFAATGASGQVVERNLPPAAAHVEDKVPVPASPSAGDSRPIGPPLNALIAINGNDSLAPVAAPTARVDLHRVSRLRGQEARFARFVGKPISRKLIAEIQAEVVRLYRNSGHPFVHLSTPPQEISGGVLQIRVLDIVLGKTKVAGADKGEAAYIARRVSLKPGDSIDKDALSDDLDWLNRYPFRQTEVVFAPSSEPGGTDLTLNETYQTPWSISAGYANSGSPNTGMERYFLVAQAHVPGVRDSLVSYQATVSGDALFNGGNVFSSASRPRYQSQALRLTAPTAPRQSFDLTVNYVRTNQPFQIFLAEGTIVEATPSYRTALSNLVRDLRGEVVVGLELKRDLSRITFGGIQVNQARIDVYQLLLGYGWRGDDWFGRTSLEANLHISPGGINRHNTDVAFGSFSTGRFTDSSYTLLNGTASHSALLKGVTGLPQLRFDNTLIWQYASTALPPTEQMGIGGVQLVRGYTLDDGAFDRGVILRNEVRAEALSLTGKGDLASPYLFVDAGYVGTGRTGARVKAGSVGAGLDYRVGKHISLSADAAMPFVSGGLTQRGHGRLECRLSVAF